MVCLRAVLLFKQLGADYILYALPASMADKHRLEAAFNRARKLGSSCWAAEIRTAAIRTMLKGDWSSK